MTYHTLLCAVHGQAPPRSRTMETLEICRLTEEAIARILADRRPHLPEPKGKGRRAAPRWPFPGTVELWIPEADGLERYALATSLNLSLDGTGIRCDEPLSPGLELAIAIHEPEMSFHGHAVVRHCNEIEGDYLIGLQFLFDS